jgi:hypothetical protein
MAEGECRHLWWPGEVVCCALSKILSLPPGSELYFSFCAFSPDAGPDFLRKEGVVRASLHLELHPPSFLASHTGPFYHQRCSPRSPTLVVRSLVLQVT